jgi:hypothetical protein
VHCGRMIRITDRDPRYLPECFNIAADDFTDSENSIRLIANDCLSHPVTACASTTSLQLQNYI